MKKVLKGLHLFILFIVSFIFVGSLFLKIFFSKIYLEEVMFYITNGIGEIDTSSFITGVLICLPIFTIFYFIICSIFYDMSFGRIKKVTKKGKNIYPFNFKRRTKIIITCCFFSLSIVLFLWAINLHEFIIYSNSNSNFIEDNYVNPKDTNITFNNKRNLIIIYIESLETSLFTKEQGGYWNYEVIPELYKLLNEDDVISFYNKNLAQSYNMINGSSWTTASFFSNTSGLPFKIRINQNSYHSDRFMNGTYTLGDLLKDNGYYNEFISAAKTSFGGLKEYYTRHGSYNIIDINSLDKYGFTTTKNDLGKWGFNDNYMYEIAKNRLTELSKLDKPFNLQLASIDTHFIDGYVGNYSETKYKSQYENAYATTSRLTYEFIEWLRQQPYYENTTIVILGDHLSMQDSFFNKRGAKNRYVYGCIINPIKMTDNNKNRIFTSLDSYPTIVSAIGGEIDGDRLGLGVNLFSDNKTLAEEYGLKYLDEELKKKSVFYNEKLIDDNYLKNRN